MRLGWLAVATVLGGGSGCATAKVVEATPVDARTALLAQGPLTLELPRWPNGEAFSLAQERGKVVLLDVWATWCEPCRDALPVYAQLAQELGERGLRVFTINVDADDHALVPYVADTKLPLPILRDPGARLAESTLKVQMMPTSYVVDRKGVVRSVHEGLEGDYAGALRAELTALLGEAP